MIKVNELRVGNLVYNKVGIETVTGMTLVSIEQGFERMPIPLTPEILEAAGFEKVNPNEFSINHPDKSKPFTMYGVILTHYFSQFGTWNNDKTIFEPFAWGCNYLHQLQNLYHSLTGEGLKINLNQLQQA